MTPAGLYIYPWCFAEEGYQELMDYVRGLGVRRLYLVSAYHAGFFLHPHSPEKKVRLLEDGVAYFQPDESVWTDSRIRAPVSSLCDSTNLFGDICTAASQAQMEISAWTVCLHNTTLGSAYPECTIHNVFGDPYPHALSPGHPDARAYVAALIDDLTKNYDLHSVLLEAPNYRNRAHGSTWVSGHHHERNGIHLRDLEEWLLSLSFNSADIRSAKDAGVDVDSVQAAVRDHLIRYFEAAPEVPAELPSTIDEFRQPLAALVDYEAYFRRTEETLLQDLRQIAEPRGVKLVGNSSPAIDIVIVGTYGEPLERVIELTSAAKRTLGTHQQLEVVFRLGFTSPGMGTAIRSADVLSDYVNTALEHGADSVAFYNYAEAPRQSVEWIRQALEKPF